MTTTETLTWNRATDDEAALHAILDRVQNGDPTIVVRKIDDHIVTAEGPAYAGAGKYIEAFLVVRNYFGDLVDLISFTATVSKPESA